MEKEKAMRICQGLKSRGSQKWIRYVVNQCPEILNSRIIAQLEIPTNEGINWLSPLANDDYAEYQDQEFLAVLKTKSLSVNSFPPFLKGGGGDLLRQSWPNPPKSPFFKGGLHKRYLFADKLLSDPLG